MEFGTFIKNKRLTLGISLRGMAKQLYITPSYLLDIERETRPAPAEGLLERLKEEYKIKKEEEYLFYDLAGKSRDELPVDIVRIVKNNDELKELIRYDYGKK